MLTFDKVNVSLGGQPILHSLSFYLQEGALTALIGPNGSGKTTLLQTAGGLLPYEGTIRLEQRSLASFAPKERARRLALLPQSLPIAPFTVETLVEMGRYPYLGWGERLSPRDRQQVEQALQRTGMEALSGRFLSELSGGERQRAYLAMVLAQQAPLLMLDEPTAHLDIKTARDFLQLLRTLQRREKQTVLMVLHDLNVALEYADQLLVLKDGVLRFQGSPRACKQQGILEEVFGVERGYKEIYQ